MQNYRPCKHCPHGKNKHSRAPLGSNTCKGGYNFATSKTERCNCLGYEEDKEWGERVNSYMVTAYTERAIRAQFPEQAEKILHKLAPALTWLQTQEQKAWVATS